MRCYLHPLISVLLATAMLLTSCVRDVILDAGEKPAVVVECILKNSMTQELRLSFTKGASKEEAEPLTDAVATLIDLTESRTVGQFVKSGEEGLWTLDYYALSDHHYRLEVQVPGYDFIWAEDIMPLRANISLCSWAHDLFARDNPESDYLDVFYPDKYAYYFQGEHYWFEKTPTNPIWVYGIDMDKPSSVNGPIAGEIYTDLPTVDNFNVTEKRYIPELQKYYGREGGTNTTGVLVRNYPDLVGSMAHDRFLRIDDGGILNEPFLITCNFKHWWDSYDKDKYWRDCRPIVFMSVSDTYDAYLKTTLIMDQIKKSSDMSAIYLRENLPSNIHGGTGIFGCKFEFTMKSYVGFTFIPIKDYPKYGIDEETHQFVEN